MNDTRGKRERLDSLRDMELFSECTWEELEAIDSLGTELSVKPGKSLTKEGQGGLEFFIVKQGRAAITRAGRALGSIEAGAFFGEVALLRDTLRTATVTAETAMKVTLMHAGEFASLLSVAPSVRDKVTQAAKDRTDRTMRIAGQSVGIARAIGRTVARTA
jgi:CRP-like cAMP-binding protein